MLEIRTKLGRVVQTGLTVVVTLMLLISSSLVPGPGSAKAADDQSPPGLSGLRTPPVLMADNRLNVVNKPVELTFSDEMSWRAAITGISVDGTALEGRKYSIGQGKITIDKSIFRTSKDYDIQVKADGYADAAIIQTIGLLCITGNGVSRETVFTRAELAAMLQERTVFSATNDFPADFPVAVEGVPLRALLDCAGIKKEAQLLSFQGTDGYWSNFTVDQLLRQKRYIFPKKVEVQPLIALKRIERSADFAEMSTNDTPVLCLGQRAATEQTVLTFVKVLQTITVTTEPPEQWEQPAAKIIDSVSGQKTETVGGEVTKGTQLVLTGDAKTKLYYTTDGTEPDLDSRICNLHGCGPMAGMDEPIIIEADTTVKAKAVWPGKLDSKTAVFTFKVSDKPNNRPLFADIQHSWARNDIEELARRGLIAGRKKNYYEPDCKITRAEFAALLVRTLGLPEKALPEGQFKDVAAADWYAGSIATAASCNIITGYNGKLFKPNHSISREEMAVMIIKAAHAAGKEEIVSGDEQEQQLAQFRDRQMLSPWAEKEAAAAVKAGLITGTAERTFTPQTEVDRAQCAVILNRFIKYADLAEAAGR